MSLESVIGRRTQQVIQAAPRPAPAPAPMMEEEETADPAEEERRRRRAAFSGIQTGALGAGTPAQTGRSRLLGA